MYNELWSSLRSFLPAVGTRIVFSMWLDCLLLRLVFVISFLLPPSAPLSKSHGKLLPCWILHCDLLTGEQHFQATTFSFLDREEVSPSTRTILQSKRNKYSVQTIRFLPTLYRMKQTNEEKKNCFEIYDKVFTLKLAVKHKTIKLSLHCAKLRVAFPLSFIRIWANQSIKLQLHSEKCQFFVIFRSRQNPPRHNLIIAWFRWKKWASENREKSFIVLTI